MVLRFGFDRMLERAVNQRFVQVVLRFGFDRMGFELQIYVHCALCGIFSLL